MQEDLVSIIIPVYNAEAYIAECMECVQNQSYSNIEILFVDDGSNDKSAELCKAYEKEDSRISFFHKVNGGPASARNIGIKESHGKYLYFMDVDDVLDKNAIELLCGAYCSESVDFVIGNAKRITMYGYEYAEWKPVDQIFKNREAVKKLVCAFANDIKSYKMFWSAWGKLYRADIIKKNHLFYNENLYLYEDSLFVFEYLACCNSVYYMGKCLYTYRRYGQSNIASGKGYLGPLDFRYTVKAVKKILNEDKYKKVIKNCYSEYAIFSMFNNVRLINLSSSHDLRRLYINLYKLVKDRNLQHSISYYVQKHDDNMKIIPFFIKRKWIWMIIIAFKLQLKKLNRKN